jgi:hypothetical protein
MQLTGTVCPLTTPMIHAKHSRAWRSWLLVAGLVLVIGATPAFAQTALGSIEGVVVDAENAPVAGVSVYPVAGPAGTGRSHGVLTNADGRFRLEQLVPGTYQLSAYKVEDGYADTTEAFYAEPEHPLRNVTVYSATEHADISLQLGAKCGTLHLDVSDAVTQRPITHAVLVLQQRNSSGAVLSRDETFPSDVLTPPVDVLVSIHAPGYSNWHFSDDGRDYVTLRPGEHRTIHAALQPLPTAK